VELGTLARSRELQGGRRNCGLKAERGSSKTGLNALWLVVALGSEAGSRLWLWANKTGKSRPYIDHLSLLEPSSLGPCSSLQRSIPTTGQQQ